ncbi:MAG: glycosyltransferase family 2 protein, partial [Acidobacteriota bacterium]
DPALRGKPYALRLLVEQVRELDEEYDAYVFLDADTVVSSNILGVLDGRFQSGSEVVQVHYTVSNPTQSSASALRFIAFQLMNYVRPLGKKVLGLSCGLFGTGMGFKRDILDSHGWDAFTLAEDAEYALKLMERGVRIEFAPEATVLSRMPVSFGDARVQNLRWERGRIIMAWRYGLRFLLTGILERNPSKLAAGMDQLVPPLSVPCLAAGLLLVVSFISGKPWLIGLGLAVNVSLLGHVLLGMRSAKVPMRLYLAFGFAPWLLMWKSLIYLQSLMPGEIHWTRTERRR